MAKSRNSGLSNEMKCQSIKLKDYCDDKVIPLTIQSRVISGNTDTIYWGSYTHLWHCHSDFAELVIVISGSIINNFPNGQTILMQAGDLMLMTPGSTHYYTKGRQLKYFNLLFDTRLFELFPGILEKMPNYLRLKQPPETLPILFHLEEKPFATAASLLEDMMQEELNRSAGYEEVLFADFYRLVIHILRYATDASIDSRRNATAFRIAQIIFYMEKNSSRDLSISDLSRQVFMSESNFRHRFKEVTGLSPANYLIRLRLQKAALLLFHSNYQIEQIAFDCGFADTSYFARKFKDLFHMTARDFRKKCSTGKLNVNEEIKKLTANFG